MIRKRVGYSLWIGAILVAMSSCTDWDDHTAITDSNLTRSALEVIQADSELSIFYNMLLKSGYDSIVSDFPSCTVFAPVNTAWSTVDTADAELVQGIVGSMITTLKFRASDSTYTGKLLTVNGKSMAFNAQNGTFEEATILTPDILSANGYIHKVDQVIYRKDNIWECLSKLTGYSQIDWLTGLNTQVMDPEKSIQIGINASGKIVYDTAWMDANPFLDEVPLDCEDSTFTYVVVSDAAYEAMRTSYLPYYNTGVATESDSLARMNVSTDYAFKGLIELTDQKNREQVLVPLSGSKLVADTIDCSNGRIYLVDVAKIALNQKFKTIRIEGEDYNRCMNTTYLYKRFKRWASGGYDVMLNATTSWDGVTFATGSGNLFNGVNYWIEYLANVNTAKYKIRYVALDDYGDTFNGFLLTQKLFISMPGETPLAKGTGTYTDAIANNYQHDTIFVGQSYCGYDTPQVTYLTKFKVTADNNQYVDDDAKVTGSDKDIMTVTIYGELTMWLCNTAYSNLSLAGPMFLDYIELVPQFTE